jgi:hypothetical protein
VLAAKNYYENVAPQSVRLGGNYPTYSQINDPTAPNQSAITWNLTLDGTGQQWIGWEYPYLEMTIVTGDIITISGNYKVPADFPSTSFPIGLRDTEEDWDLISNFEYVNFIKDANWHHYSINLIATADQANPIIADIGGSGTGKITYTGSIYFNDLTVTKNSSGHITFITIGNSFSPRINVIGNPIIKWNFGNNATSCNTSPSVQYEGNETRETTLRVIPWTALTQINVGYDGMDGGQDPNITIVALPQQNVQSVSGLNNVAPYLQIWASNYNPITSIDFSEFTQLQIVEMYDCHYMTNLTLRNNTNLTRLCIENANLTELNVSDAVSLGDIRTAGMGRYSDCQPFTIIWGDIGADVWHLCIHHNNLTGEPPYAQFPKLNDLYIWNCSRSETLHPNSTNLTSIAAHNNSYTAANFSNLFTTSERYYVTIYNNKIETIDLTNDTGLYSLDAHNNSLNQSEVDRVLAIIDSFNTSNGKLNLSQNSRPSNVGLSHAANLTAKGWTVTTTNTGNLSKTVSRINTLFNSFKNLITSV